MKSLLVVLMLFAAGCVATDYGQKTTQPATTAVATTTVTQPLDMKISFVELPDSAKLNSKFVVKWKIESNQQKNITHTAVHYGNKSVSGELAADITPDKSGYTNLIATYASTNNVVPNSFSSSMVAGAKGTIYARAHVIVDSKNYWSEEKSIKVE